MTEAYKVRGAIKRLTLSLTSKEIAPFSKRMLKVKLSSKRQATFPKALCESLGLAPGDEIALEPSITDGEESWTLRPAKARQRPWLNRLNRYATGKDHSIESIRDSIAKGRGRGES